MYSSMHKIKYFGCIIHSSLIINTVKINIETKNTNWMIKIYLLQCLTNIVYIGSVVDKIAVCPLYLREYWQYWYKILPNIKLFEFLTLTLQRTRYLTSSK